MRFTLTEMARQLVSMSADQENLEEVIARLRDSVCKRSHVHLWW